MNNHICENIKSDHKKEKTYMAQGRLNVQNNEPQGSDILVQYQAVSIRPQVSGSGIRQ